MAYNTAFRLSQSSEIAFESSNSRTWKTDFSEKSSAVKGLRTKKTFHMAVMVFNLLFFFVLFVLL